MTILLGGLAAPLLVASFDATYLGFAARRGVYLGAVPASAHTIVSWVRGVEVTTEFRFGNIELIGAGTATTASMVIFALLAIGVLVRVWTVPGTRPPVDSTLVVHALLLCVLCGAKVLSPQYVLFAVPSAALLGGRRAIMWGVIGVMTILPFSSYERGDSFMAAMALRNAVLVLETLAVVRLVWLSTEREECELDPVRRICSDGLT